MINTEWSMSNIFKKIKSKIHNINYNILYHKSNTIFDSIINSINLDYLLISNDNPYLFDYNYDFTIVNSVFLTTQEIYKIHNTHTNLIVLNHNNISNTKKEDIYILNQNLTNAHIINFDRRSDEFFNKAYHVNYPIPECKYELTKNKDILIINANNDAIINNIYQQLINKNYKVNMLTDIGNNIYNLYKILVDYKVVIDLSSRLNIICSIMCGCNIVSHLNIQQHIENNHITRFNDYESIIDAINFSLNQDIPNLSMIQKTYSPQQFINTLEEIAYANY